MTARMHALTYVDAHALAEFQITAGEVPRPEVLPGDVLVQVRAFSVNPVDFKIRRGRSGTADEPVILGWDFSGEVVEVGASVHDFAIGDEVYGAGELNRAGSYAEFVSVDARLIAKKPKTLSHAEAAALPLTSLTAWEAMVARPELGLNTGGTVLIVGGAGGVGSIAIQLIKACTEAKVIATASRLETAAWCKRMGADETIDHRRGFEPEFARLNLKEVDVVFGTTHSENYAEVFPKILKPFGHLVMIDDPPHFDVIPFKRKSLSVHWELMFTKTLFDHDRQSQGDVLREVAKLVDAGRVRTTARTILKGASIEHVRLAHESAERGLSVGKIVIER